VLPALVPSLDYDALDGIHNGPDAQLTWLSAVDEPDPARKQKLYQQLTDYCRMDTQAMVEIIKAMEVRCKASPAVNA